MCGSKIIIPAKSKLVSGKSDFAVKTGFARNIKKSYYKFEFGVQLNTIK